MLRKPPVSASRSRLSASIVRPSSRPMPSRLSIAGGSSSAPASRRRRSSVPMPIASLPWDQVDSISSGTEQRGSAPSPTASPTRGGPRARARPIAHHDSRNSAYCVACAAIRPPPSRNSPAARSWVANDAPGGSRNSQRRARWSWRGTRRACRSRRGPRAGRASRSRDEQRRDPAAVRRLVEGLQRAADHRGARSAAPRRRAEAGEQSAALAEHRPGRRRACAISAGWSTASAPSTSRCSAVIGSTPTPSWAPVAAIQRSSSGGWRLAGGAGRSPTTPARSARRGRARATTASPIASIGHSQPPRDSRRRRVTVRRVLSRILPRSTQIRRHCAARPLVLVQLAVAADQRA